ncbi:hypothetical protein BC829DRAFT_419419 [Chytridium lagenaria]|nr:hypothetical protein BC829DRAFT_419419 [Chytridium lagenaria]
MFTFFARTIYECFDQLETTDENFTRTVLDALVTTIKKSQQKDKKLAAYVVLGRLIEKTKLAQEAVDELSKSVLKAMEGEMNEAATIVVLSLYHFNTECLMSQTTVTMILEDKTIYKAVVRALKEFDSQAFIHALVLSISSLCTKLPAETSQKCLELIEKLYVDGKVAGDLCDVILQTLFAKNSEKETLVLKFCEGCLKVLFSQHPVLISSRIAAMTQNTVFEPMEETGTILFLNLKHADANVRLVAYRRLVKILESGSSVDLDCLEDILLDGLKDEDAIAMAVLQLKKLYEFISGDHLPNVILELTTASSAKLKKLAVSAMIRLANSKQFKDHVEVKEALLSFTVLAYNRRSVFVHFAKEAIEHLPVYARYFKGTEVLLSKLEELSGKEKPSVDEIDELSAAISTILAANMAKNEKFESEVRFAKKAVKAENVETRVAAYVLFTHWIVAGVVDQAVASEAVHSFATKLKTVESDDKKSVFSSEGSVLLWCISKILSNAESVKILSSSGKKTDNTDIWFELFTNVASLRDIARGQSILKELFTKVVKGDALALLVNIWTSDDASSVAKAKALEMACVLLDAAVGKSPIEDFQILIPPLLLTLLNTKELNVVINGLLRWVLYSRLLSAGIKKTEIFGKDTFYGAATSHVRFVPSAIASKFVSVCLESEKEILADPAYLQKKIAAVLSPDSAEKQLSEPITTFLLSNVLAAPRLEAKSGILTLMSALNTPLKVTAVLPLIEERFSDDVVAAPVSDKDLKFRLQLIQGFTAKSSSVLFSVKSGKYLRLFLNVLLKGGPEEVSVAVQLMHDDWVMNVPPAHQLTTVWKLMEIVAVGAKSTSQMVKKALASMNLMAEFVVYALNECHKSLVAVLEHSSKRVKTDSSNHQVFYILSAILETIESNQKLVANGDLLSILFEIISDILSVNADDAPFPIEYLKQLVVSVCLSVVKQLEESKIAVREDSVRIDLIVQCIRASDNPQTHNAALLLLASLAKLLPDSVLVNTIPVFTFMGANVMRRDDNYSFFVIQQTLEVIVPALISRKSTKETYSKEVKQVSQIFVDSFTHIPIHRRLRLFILLVSTLGPREFLHMIISMLLHKASSKAPATSQDADEIPAFCLSLLQHFDCFIQFEALIRFVQSAYVMHDTTDDVSAVPSYPLSIIIGGKTLRYFKLACFEFTADALGSRGFGKKLKGNMDEAIVGQLLRFLELLLGVIEGTNVEVGDDDDVSGSVSKYNRGLLKRLYGALNALNLLLPFNVFLEVATKLIENKDLSLRRRSILLLNDRLLSLTEEDYSLNESLLQSILTQLLANIVWREGWRNVIVGKGGLGHAERAIRGLAAGCVMTLWNWDRVSSRFFPRFGYILQDVQEDSPDTEHLTFLQTIDAIIESIPLFVGTYLSDVLRNLLGRNYESQAEGSLRNQLETKKQDILNTIVEKVPIRAIIPVFQKVVQNVMEGTMLFTKGREVVADAALDFVSVLGMLIGRVEKSDVGVYSKEIVEIFLKVLDVRRGLGGDAGEEVLMKVETSAISAFLSFVLRLNESLFKPVFMNLRSWMEDRRIQQGAELRKLTFYRVVDALMTKLKSIFAPYFSGTVDPSLATLTEYTDKFVVDETWKLVMTCLQKYFAFCPEFTFSPEKFQNLFAPICEQIDLVTLHGDDYLNNATLYIVPCVGHLAVAAGKEVYWKPLNKYILNKSRSEDYMVRLVCVRILTEFYSKLGEEFLVLLPETVPFLAELMEDTEEEVQKACQELSTEIKKHLGEDLNSFFS